MNIIYVLIGLIGVCLAAPAPEPQNWPYRDSLHPYYYGYPGQTPYVYKSSLEDDEEPVERSRQDVGQSVPSLIHAAAVKQQEQLSNFGSERPTVVETGSIPPVQDRPGDSSSSKATGPSPPTVVKPGVVNPPAFPPLRPAQPPKKQQPTAAPDEDEDEDDDDDETQEEEEEEEDEEEEEEEERKLKTAIEDDEKAVPVSVVVPDNVTSLESVEVVPSQVANVSQPVKPVVEEGNDSVNEVDRPDEDTSDEGSDDSVEGVEALVPGYVTDQGEVLVPVDTVTGDQPISIVPDPYTPVARGVPLNYYGGYNGNPVAQHYQSPVPVPGRYFRQEEFGNEDEGEDEIIQNEDEEEEDEEDDAEEEPVKSKVNPKKKVPLGLIPATAPTNEDDEVEAGRFRGAFPPSRSPYLVPVTFKYNGNYVTGPFDQPVDSTEVFQYIQPLRQQPQRQPYPVRRQPYTPNNVFYSYTQQQRTRPQTPYYPTPIGAGYYQVKIKQQVPRRPVQAPYYQPNYGHAVVQRPIRPYARPYAQRPFAYPQRPVFAPRPYSNEQEQGQVYYPRPGATLHNPGERLKIKSSYELLVEPPKPQILRIRTKTRPNNKKRIVVDKKKAQIIRRKPVKVVDANKPTLTPILYRPFYNVEPHQRVSVQGQGYRQPPYVSNAYQNYREFIKGLAAGYYGQNRPGQNRPTPVIKQDEPVGDSVSNESVIQEPQQERQQRGKPKSRREAKKVKKVKKVIDPLNILKKINKKM